MTTGEFWMYYWRDGQVMWIRYRPVCYSGTALRTPLWYDARWYGWQWRWL